MDGGQPHPMRRAKIAAVTRLGHPDLVADVPVGFPLARGPSSSAPAPSDSGWAFLWPSRNSRCDLPPASRSANYPSKGTGRSDSSLRDFAEEICANVRFQAFPYLGRTKA